MKKAIAYILLAAMFFLLAGCKSEAPKQAGNNQPAAAKTQQQRLHDNGITFSHESGLYQVPELKVHLKAPAGYTIAFTTDGTTPTDKNSSGKAELDITLTRSMSGSTKMLCCVLSFIIPLCTKTPTCRPALC